MIGRKYHNNSTNILRGRAVLVLLVFVWSCTQDLEIPEIVTLKSNHALTKNNRIQKLDGRPYSGWIVSYHPSGQLQQKTGYLNGRKEGTSTAWYSNGSLQFQRFYHAGEKEGRHLGWWPKGQKKFDYLFKDGVHHGELKVWYDNGQLFKYYHFESGHESGSQRRWHANGKVLANYVVVDGRRFGLIGLKKCRPVKNKEVALLN